MEAKDTVMSRVQVNKILKKEHHFLYKDALRNIKAKLKEVNNGLG